MSAAAGKYYEAYDQRYKAIHAKGLRWAGDRPTPIVADVAARYCPEDAKLLEIGCGEGRDAMALLGQGYDLLATDASPEAIMRMGHSVCISMEASSQFMEMSVKPWLSSSDAMSCVSSSCRIVA